MFFWIRSIYMLTLVLVRLTAHFSNRQYAFFFFFFFGASWTARPAQPLGLRDVSDSCSAFFSVEPLSLRLPRDNIIFHSHSLVVCVGACGALLSVVKRQILFWQACWRNNLLIMFFSRTDHALWSACVGSFTLLTMTCMYLRAKRSCGWLASHARTSASLLFVVPSFHLSETCCGRFPCDFCKHEMRLEFPPQAWMVFCSFAHSCCFYRKHLLAFSVLLQFQLHTNRVNRC